MILKSAMDHHSRTIMPPNQPPPAWRGSKARMLLEQDIKSGKIPDHDSMAPEEVYMQRHEYSDFEFKRFRDRLKDMREQIEKKKHIQPLWNKSKAKGLLEEDMKSGRIPLDEGDMDANDIYMQRHEFSDFKFEQFATNLKSLRKAHLIKIDCANSDSAALAHDRRPNCHPKKTHNHRGELRWEGGEAERLLQLDITAGKHKMMKPELLHLTKAAYQKYPLTVFRNHIDQEVRARKYLVYHRAKKNQKLCALGLPPLDETGY
jgi:hypothetical protein